jgi:hypothetical protein|tara:strand:- start:4671 stop:4862 length:192 start_codon:yes stop_codon:yes gene_type:complete
MKGVKHFLKDGTHFKGKTHKHPDGTLMTGTKMSKSSKKLVHFKDLSKTAKVKSNGIIKKSKKP